MPSYRPIGLGDIIAYEGLEHEVVDIDGLRLTLKGHNHFGRRSVLAWQLLDEIELVGHVPYTVPPDTSLKDAGITGEDARKAKIWREVVSLLETGRDTSALPDDPVDPEFDPTLGKAERVRNAVKYLARRGIIATERTVYNMCHRWATNPTLLSFVDGRKLKDSTLEKKLNDSTSEESAPKLLWKKIGDVLDAHWRGPDIDDKFLLAKARDLVTAEEPGFDFPSRSTQSKYLKIIKHQKRWKKTANQRRVASKRPGEGFGATGASRPGEFVHADTTKVACFLIDQHGNRARYDLSILLDVYSTTVLAFALARTTTASTIVRLLARASFPRQLRPYESAAREEVESAAADYPELVELVDRWSPDDDIAPFVAIETLVIDNGMPFVAELTRRVAEALGCGVRYSRTYTPEDKAKVEKALKDIEHRLVQIMPGFTGASAENKGEVPETELLEHVVMVQLLQDFFDNVWANTQSRGLSDPLTRNSFLTPNQVLRTALAIAPSIPVPDVAENYIRHLESGYRRIEHYGVDVMSGKYDSRDLGPLFRQASGDPRHDDEYLVKWDPDYPTVVWVMDPHRKTWIVCPYKRIGDYERPFAREMLRGASRSTEGVIKDEVRAAMDLVARYDRYRTPVNLAGVKQSGNKRAAKGSAVELPPHRRATKRAGVEGIRLVSPDEEIET